MSSFAVLICAGERDFFGAVIRSMAVYARDGAAPSDLAAVPTPAIESWHRHRS